MKSHIVRRVLVRTYDKIGQNHTLYMSAALSYYFVLSLFPTLVFLSATVAYLPIPDLANQGPGLLAHLLPSVSLGLIHRALADVTSVNRGTVLSVGILGTLWTSSSAFSAIIEAVNMAYEINDDRSFWKIRPLAVGLALTMESLMLITLSVMIVGPKFGEWLGSRVHLSSGLFALLWPYLRWAIAVGFAVLAIETLYFWAPNTRQRFRATLPGATLAVALWIGLSYLVSEYFRHFASFNKTYGTLGAGIALMVWFYWTGFVMLVGAQLNAELAKASEEGKPPGRPQLATIAKIHAADCER